MEKSAKIFLTAFFFLAVWTKIPQKPFSFKDAESHKDKANQTFIRYW